MAVLRACDLEELELDEEVIWAGNYSSAHEILLVGEGDFSFSLSLAKTFGSAFNIVATSLDSYNAVVSKYSNAKSNLSYLSHLGATILHGVDATRMRLHPDLRQRRFDRIVFNFPHAGFKGREDNPALIGLHRKLVQGFLRNARVMLRQGRDGGGEVHVSHKMGATFCRWDLPGLARGCGYVVAEVAEFRAEGYPGYRNKRGDGARADQPFPLKECCTYMFVPGREEKRKKHPEVGFEAVNWSVGPCGGGIGSQRELMMMTPPPFVADFGQYVHVCRRDGSWSIGIDRPVPLSPTIPSTSWLSPPRAAVEASPEYFQRAYEDEVLARCQRLLNVVETFGSSVDTWRRVPPQTSSSCLFGLRQHGRGAEAADIYRDPYCIY